MVHDILGGTRPPAEHVKRRKVKHEVDWSLLEFQSCQVDW